jgi:tripartite-type tricarboxylate transporter receptor subunit TctC
MRTIAGYLLVLVAAAMVPNGAARADAVADFYKGKTVTIHIGFGPGGGYDTTTRLFARHLSRHIPGNPTIVSQNMPGAGSMKAANFLFNAAPKDGTQLAVFASSTALEPLFGNEQAKYKTTEFSWIGSLHRDIASCTVWKGAGQNIRSLDDLLNAKQTVIYGSTSPSAITSQHPSVLKNYLGAPIRVITGYTGTKEISLAMQKGEVHGSCGMMESSVKSAYAQEVASGDLKVIVQFGADRAVPFFGDATRLYDRLKRPEDRKLLDVIFRQTELARPLAAPPGTPKDRIAALRKAMLDTLKDPALVEEAKRFKVELDPVPGEEMEEIFAGYYRTPPELLKQAAALIESK